MSSAAGTSLIGRIAGSHTPGLRLLLYAGKSSTQHHQPVGVCSECCGTPGVFFSETPPCVATSSTTALVEDGAAPGRLYSIWYKLALLVYCCLYGLAPPYVLTNCSLFQVLTHGDDCEKQQPPTLLSFRRLVSPSPPSVIGLFRLHLPQLGCGTD